MDINDLILSDEALNIIDNGTWVEVDELPGVEFLVTGLKSEKAQKAMKQTQAEMRMKNRGKELSDKQLADCTRAILWSVVLKDWKGLTSNGKPLPYSVKQAKEWITSRNGEKLAELVLGCAQKVDAQASDFVEEVAKKSKPTSDGD